MNRYVPPELESFVNQVGDFIEYWGFKNVQGRIWAHIYLSQEPLDAAELMKRLNISKALVSISLKEMLEYDVLQEAGKSERGTIVYKANENQEQVIMNVLRGRERMMLARVSSALKLCKGLAKSEKEKMKLSEGSLDRAEVMVGQAESFLDLVLQAEKTAPEVWTALSQFAKQSLALMSSAKKAGPETSH